MKKTLCMFALLILGGVNGFSQTVNDTIALQQMNKVQLSQIYLSEVNRVTKKLPTIAFDSSMADVPKSKYLGKKFQSVNKKVASYNETLLSEYAEIIPYADKKDLVNAILYLRGL